MADSGSENEDKPKEPEPPQQGKKIFLSHCNSYEGQAMFKELWNKDKFEDKPEWMFGAHTFTGTVRKEERNARGGFEEPPAGIDQFVDFERTQDFRKKLLENDVIIYDLMSNTFEEVDYVIKTLKTSDYPENKTLVLLSSVMTWVNTPPKLEEEVKEGEEGEDGEDAAAEEEGSEEEAPSEEEEDKQAENEDEEEQEPELDENGEPIVVKQPLYFKETDYHLRVPHEDYNHIKTLETTAMSAVKTQPKLRVHVLCSGIRYGNGERTFYDHFQKAWIQDPKELPIIGEGENLVPTIHIIDLSRLVRRVVVENPKEHPYIFAIDKTRKPTSKRLITEISKGMGTGKLANVSADSVPSSAGWKMKLAINLRMKASDAFKAMPLTAEETEMEQEDQDKLIEEKKFQWHTKFGIRKNIRSLEKEFNSFRGLNPVKIFITGPPASGKTFYSEKLAVYYNIPRVHVKQLVDEVFRMAAIDEEAAGEDVLINNCRTKLEEIKAAMEEEINEKRADMEEPEDGWPEIVIEDSEIRVPDDLLQEVLKLKLGENDCRNRGYILDGYPRVYRGAQNSFLKKVIQLDEDGQPIEEDEEELPEGELPSFDKHVKDQTIFPGSIVVMEGRDEDLVQRVRELPEDQILGSHYTPADMKRRLKDYRLANNSTVAEPAVQDFFREQGIKFFQESIQTRTKNALNAFQIYIERNEKPYNFMTFDEVDEDKRRQEYEIAQAAKVIQEIASTKQEENLEKIIRKQKEQQTKHNVEVYRERQKDILDTESQNIRMYLQDNLVTFLAEGLQDICVKQPDDPVDALAEYLFKRSLDVRYPDPTQY